MGWASRGWAILGIVCLLLPVASSFGAPTGGLIAVHSPTGAFLGTTHGPDPVPSADDEDALPGPFARQPTCVDALAAGGADAHAQVIYARAHDDDDTYAAKLPVIRQLVRNSNGLVYDAGLATGTPANLKVACANGDISVLNEVLPTDKVDADFGTILLDLAAKGYANPRIKYWIYYDDRGACACGGTALLWNDQRPGPVNLNNGFSPLPMIAVDFGYDSTLIMLHELSHTMGAVQSGAPHTTEAGHCWDGRDIMCYNDGGEQAFRYTNAFCATSVYDCGRDDYFNANPPEGSYLAESWNLGSRWNQFIDFEDTIVGPVPVP